MQASCTAWAANPAGIALQFWIDGGSIGLTSMASNVAASHMTLPTFMGVVNLSAGQHSITVDKDSNNDFPQTRIDVNDVCNISILEIQ